MLERFPATAAALLAILSVTSCDSGTGIGGPPIVISALWENAADFNHTIDFRTPDDGLSSGVLAGTEEGGPCQLARCRVGGFWRDGRLEITIIREANVDQPKFAASVYENMEEIVFNQVGGSEAFTLVR